MRRGLSKAWSMGVPPPSDQGPDPSFRTYHRTWIWRKPVLAAATVTLGAVYAFLRWRPVRVEVRGTSMAPTLEPGDWVLAVAPGRLRRGEIGVVERPDRPGFEMVKRILAIPGDLAPDGRVLLRDELWVEGDAPEDSTDSRTFGPVRREHVKAEARLVYWPPERKRLL